MKKLKLFDKTHRNCGENLRYSLSLKKYNLKNLLYDRTEAILLYNGDLYHCDTCHQSLLEEISYLVEDENDLVFVSLIELQNGEKIAFVHADVYFDKNDVDAIRAEFNCPIGYEMIVDNQSFIYILDDH